MSRRNVAMAAAGAVIATVVVGSLTWGREDDAAPVVPDPEVVYSQDAEVVATAALPPLYFFEQRPRPDYRVVRFDPSTGDLEPVFAAPPDMLVFGLDVARHGRGGADVLVLAATMHPDRDRSGLYTVDLSESAPAPRRLVGDDRPDRYWAHPEATADGVAATVHDADSGQSAVAVVDPGGELTAIEPDAIQPAAGPDDIGWLAVDRQSGRRRVVVSPAVGGGGGREVQEVDADLDFPLITADGSVWVAVLEPAGEPGPTFGRAAGAHGSHRRPSRWRRVRPASDAPVSEPIVAYDAAVAAGDTVIVAGADGIHAVDTDSGATTKLVHSRAIRYLAV